MSFKSDGNGGYIVQKGTFTLIMVFISLVSCITTVVAYNVTMNNEISNLKEKMVHSDKCVEQMEIRIDLCEKYIASSEVKLVNIHEDLQEIKELIKE